MSSFVSVPIQFLCLLFVELLTYLEQGTIVDQQSPILRASSVRGGREMMSEQICETKGFSQAVKKIK